MSETCVLRLVERLPTGICADQYELQGIQRSGGFMEAQIHGDVNLEQPTLLSAQAILNVHVALLKVENDGKNGSASSLQARVTLLLHARYPVIQSYYPSFWQRIDMTSHSICWKREFFHSGYLVRFFHCLGNSWHIYLSVEANQTRFEDCNSCYKKQTLIITSI